MGIVSAFGLCAVVILAVAERPGRRSSGGVVQGHDDLEVLGLFGAGGALRGGEAGGAEQGLVADFGDVALEGTAGKGVNGDVGGLAKRDVDDVGLVDLDLGGDDGHVGEGHQGGAVGVLDADDYGFALADGDIGDEAVEGGAADGLVEGIEVGRAGWRRPGRRGRAGRRSGPGLGQGGLPLSQGSRGDVVRRLLGVEVLLGDELARCRGPGRGRSRASSAPGQPWPE